jgi:hypothetical protein
MTQVSPVVLLTANSEVVFTAHAHHVDQADVV